MRQNEPARPHPREAGFDWLDAVRAAALLWIVLVHWTERVFGFPAIANPNNAWVPLSERIAQLAPLDGYGWANLPVNLLRWIGWFGDQGVNLFLIASGIGLTWGLLQAGGLGSVRRFYATRAMRIYPPYWLAHVGILVGGLLVGKQISAGAPYFWLSLLGLRIDPDTIYKYAPAWWYVGLILQLYLVYPLLYRLLDRYGWQRFLLIVLAASVLVRGAGLWLFAGPLADWGFLDAWSRGAIFVSRLPEFAFGMAFAAALFAHTRSAAAAATATAAEGSTVEAVLRRLRAPRVLLAAAGCWLLGTLLSLFLIGNALSPLLLGAGGFLLLLPLLRTSVLAVRPGRIAVAWLSRHVYALFLVHHLLIIVLIPPGAALGPALALRTVAVVAGTVVLALLLERMTALLLAAVRHLRARWGVRKLAMRTLLVAGSLYVVLLAAEVAIRRSNPPEFLGWGERASLRPDAALGWTMIPGQTTRLRWQSYDYTVYANALGFPGPAYPQQRQAGALRILVTGDAYASGEGVDTDQAWPRLLEAELSRRLGGQPVEVMNVAITGWGPTQYARVLARQAPAFRPDVILVSVFVNDFDDAATDVATAAKGIGFDLPAQDSVFAVVTLSALYQTLGETLRRMLYTTLLGRPDPAARYLGHLWMFANDGDDPTPAAIEAVRGALADIRSTADAIGARVLISLVPAGAQVCRPEALPYLQGADLLDAQRFDADRPQRILGELAATEGIASLDLRGCLRALPACPYFPANLHWRREGHAAVAACLADTLGRRQPAPAE